jgi:hypothetical protein
MRHFGWTVGLVGFMSFLALGACGSGESNTGPQASAASPALSAAKVSADDEHPRNPQAFEPHSSPYGTSMERWAEKLWQWIYSVPFAQNPFLDTTGVDCAVQQPDGDVWYLPPVPGPGGTASFTRSCTLPRGKALLLLMSGVLNDYPCPEPPPFQPADGQTLYEFLLAGAQGGPNSLTAQSLSVDGVVLKHIFDYRETSDDLFTFTGNISNQAFDGCVTGTKQPAVSDAFVLMLRPLPPGAHTLVYKVQDTHGTNLTLTYQLSIQ